MSGDEDQESGDLVDAAETFVMDETVPMSDQLPPLTPAGARDTAPPRTGRLADRYQILGLLGRGGMGNVYRVRDEELDEVVALKMLHNDLASDGAAIDRFRAEVRLARRVTHRNVARTFDIGMADGLPFLTMEFIEGEPLDVTMSERDQLDFGTILEMTMAMCDGLAAAHDAGVVHQDLKPPNVLVEHTGRVVISDFGIARARDATTTQAGGLAGTPAYMAPEQIRGVERLDGRADIYALGIMLFEMLSGRLPFVGPTALATALARMLEPVPPLPEEVPGTLAEVVRRCLQLDREERYGTALELQRDLSAVVDVLRSGDFRALPAGSVRDATAGSRAKRVAVLPLKLRGDSDNEHLSAGLTEELIDELSMSPGLRVKPPSAVAPYDGDDIDPLAVGRQLGVDVVIDGSFRINGSRVSVRLSALSVEEGFQVWSQRFEGPPNIFAVCSDAVEAITSALTVEAVDARRTDLTDPVTIDLYMRARQLMRANWHGEVLKAEESWERVLKRAPDDPRVLAGAATFFARASVRLGGDDDAEARAREYVERAIEEAPRWPEPYCARAVLNWNRYALGDALRDAHRALDLAPGYVDAHQLAGKILLEIGPLDEGIRHLEIVLSNDPNAYSARGELVRARALKGDWAGVDALLALDVHDATYRFLRQTICARTDLWRETPRWQHEPLLEPTGNEGLGFYLHAARTLVEENRLPDAYDVVLAYAEEVAETRPRIASLVYQHACEFVCWLEDGEMGVEMARRAVQTGLLDVVWLRRCPLLDSIRDTESFRELHREVERRVEKLRSPIHQLA